MSMKTIRIEKARGLLRRLRTARSGIAITEFALAAPFMMVLGAYGLETSNLVLTHLRMSQISANLADTASRIGQSSPSALKKIRESDINDAFQAVRLQQGNTLLSTNGRVILSSLEQNASGGQWIHWQRCLGLKNYTSTYGAAGVGATGTAFKGMGDLNKEIQAPAGSAVMFVEIIYDYQPLISAKLLGVGKKIHAKAAFLVRDKRDLDEGDNPSPGAAPMSCNAFTV
jgi:hypothetical protein